MDFSKAPFIVYVELTQACDLACVHCRADANPFKDTNELKTEEVFNLVDNVLRFGQDSRNGTPIIVFTGGDPLKRDDLFDVLKYSISKNIRTCIAPSVTPLLTEEAIIKLKEIGIARVAISLDGSCAKIHDNFRGIDGAFARTLQIFTQTQKEQIGLQINTVVTKYNLDDIENIGNLLKLFPNIVMWSVFFLVPTGRAKLQYDISASDYEKVFEIIYNISKTSRFEVKSTEAPHYRRFVIQKNRISDPTSTGPFDSSDKLIGRMPTTNDGKGIMFVSHIGQIFPSGFLQIPCGNVRSENIIDIYRNSQTFVLLRDFSQLKGKCGVCEFKNICGGSRSRSFYMTGDLMESDPKCLYIPRSMQKAN